MDDKLKINRAKTIAAMGMVEMDYAGYDVTSPGTKKECFRVWRDDDGVVRCSCSEYTASGNPQHRCEHILAASYFADMHGMRLLNDEPVASYQSLTCPHVKQSQDGSAYCSLAEGTASDLEGRLTASQDALKRVVEERNGLRAELTRVGEDVKAKAVELASGRERYWMERLNKGYDRDKELRMSEAGHISALLSGAIDVDVIIKKQARSSNGEAVSMSYECSWCKIGGLSKEEYTKEGAPTCHDSDTNLPICEDCADAAGGRN